MEGLGQKFQNARAARNLTLEEAARMTKIRPSKLAEIEAEDFSQFPSLAYAKGFLLIYGKFLNVDVTPYLEAFETSEHVTVDGYSYLQDNPVPPPRRTEVVRPRSTRGGGGGGKSSLMPLVIGIVILVAGFSLLKLMLDVRRITPATTQRDAQALAQAPSATAVAPSPAAGTAPAATGPAAAPTAPVVAAAPSAAITAPSPAAEASAPVAAPQPTIAAAEPVAPEEEPEIRRAEPVHPEDLLKAQAALASPSPKSVATLNNFDIRPLRKTYVRVVVDGASGPAVERWLNISEAPLQLRGQKIAVKVLDPAAVEIRKNGKVISRGDADVRLE